MITSWEKSTETETRYSTAETRSNLLPLGWNNIDTSIYIPETRRVSEVCSFNRRDSKHVDQGNAKTMSALPVWRISSGDVTYTPIGLNPTPAYVIILMRVLVALYHWL